MSSKCTEVLGLFNELNLKMNSDPRKFLEIHSVLHELKISMVIMKDSFIRCLSDNQNDFH